VAACRFLLCSSRRWRTREPGSGKPADFGARDARNTGHVERGKEATMYISGGVLAEVVVIALLIWLL
jgi:hypothetical protein